MARRVASREPKPAPAPVEKLPVTEGDPLEGLNFYLGRTYYYYVGLLERVLAEMKLDEHLRPGMGHVLFALYEQDNRIIKELVQRTDLSPSTLTELLARMERSGLIERRRDARDGRAVRVRLTELGKSLQERCRAYLLKVNEMLCSGLSATEIDQMRQGLSRMIEAMKAAGV